MFIQPLDLTTLVSDAANLLFSVGDGTAYTAIRQVPAGSTLRAMAADAIVDCGWGRLLFAQTFETAEPLVEALRAEGPDRRDIAFYVRNPHVLLAQAPQLGRYFLAALVHVEQAQLLLVPSIEPSRRDLEVVGRGMREARCDARQAIAWQSGMRAANQD